MKFKPLRDRVLVKYSEESERTAGGLYIPDTAKEKPQKGEIVAVGPPVVAGGLRKSNAGQAPAAGAEPARLVHAAGAAAVGPLVPAIVAALNIVALGRVAERADAVAAERAHRPVNVADVAPQEGGGAAGGADGVLAPGVRGPAPRG